MQRSLLIVTGILSASLTLIILYQNCLNCSIKEKPVLPVFQIFLLRNCRYWASCYASTAINACAFIASSLTVITKSDSSSRANTCASTTTDAKILINCYWHVYGLLLMQALYQSSVHDSIIFTIEIKGRELEFSAFSFDVI
jgi:hypothetical protein